MQMRQGKFGEPDFSKTINAFLNVPVNAIVTWYYSSCTESAGVGNYVTNIAPKYGSLSFFTINAPVPSCPAGSPALPASEAAYTWTYHNPSVSSDSFELYYELGGQVEEVADITAVRQMTLPPPQPSPSPSACETYFGQDWSSSEAYVPNAYHGVAIADCNYISTTSFDQGPPFPLFFQQTDGYCGQASAFLSIELEQPDSPITFTDITAFNPHPLDVAGLKHVLSDFGFSSSSDGAWYLWSSLKGYINENSPIIAEHLNIRHYNTVVGWAETTAGVRLVKIYDTGVAPDGVTRTMTYSDWKSQSDGYVYDIVPQ